MFSSAGTWSFIVVTGWLVLVESDSSGWVGLATFASMIPLVIVAPIGGLLGDIYDRRTIALFSFVGNAAVVSVMALLAATGALELWHVILIAFAGGVARSIQEPAMQALTPNQVPRGDLLNALVLNGMTRHGGRFVGPLVAVPLLTVDAVGVPWVLVLSAVFHALGAFQMLRTRTVSTGQTRPEAGLVRNMVGGLSYIYSHHMIAMLIILVAFHCALVMSFESILPVFSREELVATEGDIFGFLIVGFGAGSLAGLLAMAGVRGERRKGQILVLTGLVSGVTPMMLALSGSIPVAILFAAGMGASQATFMALTNTYVQVMAPDRLRARISSLYTLHAGGIMAFANLGYGFMADIYSAPPILLSTGALFIAVLVSLGAVQPVLRRVYLTGQVSSA